MSFKRLSAVLRSNWFINKQWADEKMPLIFSFINGNISASELIGDNDITDECLEPLNIGSNIYKINCGTDLSNIPANSIALLSISGPMFKTGDVCSYGMEDYSNLINAVAANKNIVGLVIQTDTPGGQSDGPATLSTAIKNCTNNKPVIGFINDGMCCSAGYFFLSACTEIYCSQPTDVVGSIGTYCTIADWQTYYQQQGLPVKDVYAPQSTNKNIEYRESIAGDDTKLKDDLKFITNNFINTVKQNRAGKLKTDAWKTGASFFAGEALQVGLIDGIKNFNQTIFSLKRLINSNTKNSNIMAFEKTLIAAGAESFQVVDGGFLLTEENLNTMEAMLAGYEENLSALTGLQTENATLTEAKKVAENSLIEKEKSIADHLETIAALNEKLSSYGSKPSGEGSTVTTVATTEPLQTQVKTREAGLMNDNHPLNILADELTCKTTGRKNVFK